MTDAPILAAVDLLKEDRARAVLREAAAESEMRGLPLTVIAVVPEAFSGLDWRYAIRGKQERIPSAERRKLVEDTLKRLTELIEDEIPEEIEADSRATVGVVYEKVLAAADAIGAAMIVISAGGSKAAGEKLGANAARVVRHAACPVLLLR